MLEILAFGGGAAALALVPLARRRFALSRAKHPSLAGHARLAKRFARLVPAYSYDDGAFFNADGAPPEVVARRRSGMARLAALYARRFARGSALTQEARASLSDLQFTSAYRVPFQFSRVLREHLKFGNVMSASQGVTLTDPDGNVFYDLTGSYGVNVFGHDFYKACIAEGSTLVQDLGPVLGALHPCVLDNLRWLREISGLDEVSFHMSGTEAVMQAVRLARYHTGRTHLVRFSGSYHGWWDDVQPGPGNPAFARATYTLREMHAETLRVVRTRKDIACVLVNPVQALHPNANPPADSGLVDSARSARYDRAAYAAWLKDLRAACAANGVVLILDEVLVGFRLAPGGAQDYFGVRADLVTYGKTIAGGLPIGVVCGRRNLMKRFRDERPADVCLARGTFNSHPYVMGAMHVFLERLQRPEVRAIYAGLDATWDTRAEQLNRRLEQAGMPVRVANLSTVWTVFYTAPSRYNWMLQFYLRAAGLALSWVGTGRLIFSLDYTQADFDAVAERFAAAAQAMHADGWWAQPAALTNKAIRRTILAEMLRQRF
ncbi:MAG TPA: aminotransferase class III-fold pyridoxal phosphate-dependent enzyme [Burkholderiaceae bacterium]|nr:aminotransferase class III-fold pyridoxal phosphate-dependent enzyme [Burkholderiaceae bacterium]